MRKSRVKAHWLLLLALLWPLVQAPAAQARFIGPYLQVQAGGYLPDVAPVDDDQGSFNLEFSSAPLVGGAVGYDLDPDWGVGEGRVELAYGYLPLSADQVQFVEGKVAASGDLTVQTLLLNVWGTHRTDSDWTPYLGGGVGLGWVKADQLQVSGQPLADGDDLALAYQLGLGVDYALSGNCWLDLGYRFFGVDRAGFDEAGGGRIEMNLHGHSLDFGLRLGF